MAATVADVRRSARRERLRQCRLDRLLAPFSPEKSPGTCGRLRLFCGRVQFDWPVGRHLSLNRRPFLVWVQGDSLAGLNSAFITETKRARQSCINKSSINEGQVFCFSTKPLELFFTRAAAELGKRASRRMRRRMNSYAEDKFPLDSPRRCTLLRCCSCCH